MTNRGYELSTDAEEDIRGITQYTVETWGARQAQRYLMALEERLNGIAHQAVYSKTLFAHWPELRFCRCEHHYAFFVHRQGKPPLVLAVLHEKMDIIARARTRLLPLLDDEK